MIQFERWEIWEARVPFRETKEEKKRPVIIISEKEALVLVLKITSHSKGGKGVFGEYELAKWQEAGLLKPCKVECGSFLKLEKARFTGKKYGKLKAVDVAGLRDMMKFFGLKE